MKYILSGIFSLFITSQIIGQHISTGTIPFNGNIYHLDNNVGIGTSTPDAKFVVHNQDFVNPSYLKVNINDGTKQFELLNTTDNSSSDKHTIFSIVNKRKSGSADNGGATILSLGYDASNLKSPSEIQKSSFLISNGDLNNGVINFYNHNADYSIFQESKLLEINGNENYVRTNISTQHADHFRWEFDNNERMRVTSQGNVGIGTANPLEKLDVNGSIRMTNASIPMGLMTEVGGTTPLLNVSVNFRGAGVNNSYKGASFRMDTRNNYPLFNWLSRDAGSSSDIRLMALTQDGKLGIGTANPDSKLTVKGGIHAEEVIVDLSVPGPDYVFEEDYDLISLESTQAYIKENKHLPEVPSAKEMEEKGIDLGVMNMLLLKKVEELTLHLIEQSEKIEAQGKEIQFLKDNYKHSK